MPTGVYDRTSRIGEKRTDATRGKMSLAQIGNKNALGTHHPKQKELEVANSRSIIQIVWDFLVLLIKRVIGVYTWRQKQS